MKQRATQLLLIALLSIVCPACTPHVERGAEVRGIYHWKTTFDPTPWEKQWMTEHHVQRLYVKLFEIDRGDANGWPGWAAVPTATTRFLQSLPDDMEVIPVVYITVRALDEMNYSNTERYASLLVERIYAMMEEHWGGTVRQVQLDCDWTSSRRYLFFDLASEVGRKLHRRGAQLGGTVRLHQLGDADIPFDCPLLMVYNTGHLQSPDARNSILDYADVAPYLKPNRLEGLDTFDVAWPAYGWSVVFDSTGHFSHLASTDSVEGARVEWGEVEQVEQVRRHLPSGAGRAVVLYHLDSAGLSHYTYDDIERMYGRTSKDVH